MERPKRTYFCNKCGYVGETSEHEGCGYFAVDSFEQRYIDQLEKELTSLRAFNQACKEQEVVAWRKKLGVGYIQREAHESRSEPLYSHPDPEAAQLRMRVKELESQTCNCRWDGETQTQQCTLHNAHVEAIHDWTSRAKAAEQRIAELEAEKSAWCNAVQQRDELESQLATRDQQVAEACAAECEGIDAINSRGWGDVLAKRIRSDEWKKHMKGVE